LVREEVDQVSSDPEADQSGKSDHPLPDERYTRPQKKLVPDRLDYFQPVEASQILVQEAGPKHGE
jgi:hypothetical protein